MVDIWIVAKVLIGLAIVVLVNNLLGSITAIVEGDFNPNIAKKGALKGGMIALVFVLLYFAGLCVPELSIATLNDTEVTLHLAIEMILTAGFIYYAALDVEKLIELINVKVTVTPTTKKK